MDFRLSLAGLLVGVLVGATGMGGGSLLTPLLVLLFGFNPTVAVGTDLLHGAMFKSVGAIRHRMLGTVQGRLSAWMLVGSGPASLAGVWIATWLRHTYSGGVQVQLALVAGALIVGGVGTMLKGAVRFRERPEGAFEMRPRDKIAAVTIGVLGGLIVGMTSVGSGVFFGLTLLIVFPLRSSKVVGTDVLHGAALLWIAGVAHLVAGNVDLSAVGLLLIGSIPGVLIGSSVVVRVPDRTLRLTMGVVLLVSGAKLMPIHQSNEAMLIALAAALLVVAALRAHHEWAKRHTTAVSRDVRWQQLDVEKGSRAALMAQRPCVVWFTGLSGAGKSTIANEVERQLHELGKYTYILDGDNVRHGLNSDLGFGDADRTENIRRVAEVARLMVDAGLIVLVAFISPFVEDRQMARTRFAPGEFLEVFVDTPLDVAEARDPKGLYKKARAGQLANFTGVDSPYDRPTAPDLRLDTTKVAFDEAAAAVIAELEARGFIGGRLAPLLTREQVL